MVKIVVFGADGFIGRHLIRRLSPVFDGSIVAFDRFSAHQTGNSEHPFEKLGNVTMVAGNFFNRDEVSKVLEGTTYVFHLISTTNPATANNDPFIDIDTNVRKSVELFQLCVEHKVKRVVFPSSGGTVYGDIDSDKINELTAPSPRSPYGIGKLTIEHYLRYFNFTASLDYIVYRIANPFGPGQNVYGKQGVIPIFMHKFLEKEPLTIFGDGSMVRDYIYIEDLMDMVVGSYAKRHKYNEYNIGCGKAVTINQVVKAIEECAEYNADKLHVEVPQTFVQKSVLDISRFTEEFAIYPETTLKEGLRKTWNYVKNIK